MKKILSFLIALVLLQISCQVVLAQVGTITTCGYGATLRVVSNASGQLFRPWGAYIDLLDSTGSSTPVAGGGSVYGDGGPAISALLNKPQDMAFDIYGNMYLSDSGDAVIRKVNTAGIITTIAGNISLGHGYTGDGGPATAAKIHSERISTDGSGNIYFTDPVHNVIRKIDAAGIITTVAGNGSAGFSGDGGPATAAQIDHLTDIAADMWGNFYIGDSANYRVRKVNAAGIISTFAGNGAAGAAGVGGPATAANLDYPSGLATDASGNVYITEANSAVVVMVDVTGTLYNVAGNYTTGFSTGDGGAATAATLQNPKDVTLDASGNIYIPGTGFGRIRKVRGAYMVATHVADSFSLFVNKTCSGPQLNIFTPHYVAASSVKTYFGDGTTATTTIAASSVGGNASTSHVYPATGTYTLKQVLYYGSIAVDSFSISYTHIFCTEKSLEFFYDNNTNCNLDSGENYISHPVLVQVDSNGTTIDTISSLGYFYYTAYGNPGDVYSYRMVAPPAGMHVTCPSSGVIYDTLVASIYGPAISQFGFACSSSGGFDLAEYSITPTTGMRDQIGGIYVSNIRCAPTTATVKLNFSPKYEYHTGEANPTPSATTATSISWNITTLTSLDAFPRRLQYQLWNNTSTGLLTVGDTVHTSVTISPSAGDTDTSNNTEVVVDTVRASCDPNEITVSPAGHVTSGTELTYTVHFENTGTDTAYNIYVLDTLSGDLDPTTFRIVTSSVSEMHISKLMDAAHHTIMKFDFPNIKLLDSSYHDLCTAMFIYKIKTKAGLPDCTHIISRAGIYFDYNAVCMTNEAESVIGCWPASVAAVTQTNAEISPNPATNELSIKMGNGLFSSYSIANGMGINVASQSIIQPNTVVDIQHLPAGLYYVTLRGANGSVVKKFIKM